MSKTGKTEIQEQRKALKAAFPQAFASSDVDLDLLAEGFEDILAELGKNLVRINRPLAGHPSLSPGNCCALPSQGLSVSKKMLLSRSRRTLLSKGKAWKCSKY